jgi:hypothetical protein
MFTSEFLRKLEYLLLVSRRAKLGGFFGGVGLGELDLAARNHKKHFGNGTEFADHRIYSQGDDLRNLDWNLFARLDEHFVKRFQTETDNNIYFLLDCSKSMQTGIDDFNKHVFAKKVIAALAYIFLAGFNRVGVACFGNGLSATFPPIRNKKNFQKLLKFLEQNKPNLNTTNLNNSIDNFVKQTKRSGVVFVVSDFFDRENFQSAIDKLLYNKFNTKIIQIYSESESNPILPQTNLNLISLENESDKNNTAINLTINPHILKQYKICFNNFLENLKKYCTKNNLDLTTTNTSNTFDKLILKMLQK